MEALLGQITLLDRFNRSKAHSHLSQRAWDILTDLPNLVNNILNALARRKHSKAGIPVISPVPNKKALFYILTNERL